MRIEDIDVVESHAPQALIETGQHIFARAAALPVRPGPHVPAGLGGNDQLVAMGVEIFLEQAAKVGLGASIRRAVVIREIEMRDAQIESRCAGSRADARAACRRRSCATGLATAAAASNRCGRPADTRTSHIDRWPRDKERQVESLAHPGGAARDHLGRRVAECTRPLVRSTTRAAVLRRRKRSERHQERHADAIQPVADGIAARIEGVLRLVVIPQAVSSVFGIGT